MTDSELLAMAAKAAGINAQWDCYKRGMMALSADGIDAVPWNPLVDDGDALRLAVELKFTVYIMWDRTIVEYDGDESLHEMHDDNPRHATRRAIVRLAARIEKKRGFGSR